MTKTIKMNAWLLTWITLPPKNNLEPIAAILSSRKSDKLVAEFVELLYLRSTYSAFDMAYYANRRREMPSISKAQKQGGYVICGTNPCWLNARRVTNLIIQIDEENEKEILSWVEPPRYIFKNHELDQVIEGEKVRMERKYFSTLSKDVWY